MFAKPKWFNENQSKSIPMPRSLKGWAFYLICLAGIIVPATLLVLRHQVFPEAVIWLAFSVSAFLFELRGLKRDLRENVARSRMHYIDGMGQSPVQTERYELEIKSPG